MSWRRRPEWSDWYEWESPKPRRPANGIKAQTQRGKFGATWWAGRWLAILDDEAVARQGLPSMAGDLEWALQLIREPGRWQAAFA